MRVTGRLFGGIAAFFAFCGVVYWWLAEEPAGTAALIFTAGLGFLIAFYLLFTARRLEPMPEDEAESNIEDYAGEYGFFSPHSWWPLPLAIGAGCTALGLGFASWWLILFGAFVVITSVVGLLFEYYVGEYVRE